MESKIILTSINGKDAYKKGIDGYCYTFNKNEKSRIKAYDNANKSYISNGRKQTHKKGIIIKIIRAEFGYCDGSL